MSDTIHGAAGDEAESVATGKHIRQSTDHRNVNVNVGGAKPPEPESLSNREIFERLFRLETNAANDRFRIQVSLLGLAVLIAILALIAALWLGSQFRQVDSHFGRIENRMNGMENRLNRLFPDDFPYRYPPPFYGSLRAEQDEAE